MKLKNRRTAIIVALISIAKMVSTLLGYFTGRPTSARFLASAFLPASPLRVQGTIVVSRRPLAHFDRETNRSEGFLQQKQESTYNHRYHRLLQQLDLDQDDSLVQQVEKLSPQRTISSFDVFCNRGLKLDDIKAIGFDMDYTLAQYNEVTFAELSFDGAKQKLVERLGYPAQVLDFKFDPYYWTRGLIIDTHRGNFLKIDRHKYVRVAYHGFNEISSTTRKQLYSGLFNKVLSFSEKHFINLDTLFQFVDAHLYAHLIDMKDNNEFEVLDGKTYEELFRDVRACVDLCHRDGVIKDEVARDPAKYILPDPGMIPMLKRFRDQGLKVFLLTNSMWEYTSTAMNFLYHEKLVSEEQQKKNEWLDLFDLVVVGSCKPAYMLDPYLNLFRVNPDDGSLLNTDGIFEIDSCKEGAQEFLSRGKTFQGGNWQHLHKMLETGAGGEILYVGDHLYSDVLRSKKALGWRSVFIMPELEEEMCAFRENSEQFHQIKELRELQTELMLLAEDIRLNKEGDDSTVQAELDQILEQESLLKAKAVEIMRDWHNAFHPVWGAIFHAGYQDSRFAFYVENYACLYTSRATNLGLASTWRSFRTNVEMLPHDSLLANEDSALVTDDPWDMMRDSRSYMSLPRKLLRNELGSLNGNND